MPKLDLSTVDVRTGSSYPAPFDKPCLARKSVRLSEAGGLTQFGVHRAVLSPGTWSSQRHWHTHEDELVYILQGRPTLIDDNGETQLEPGDVTTHVAGDANGHHMINRTEEDVVFLIVGTRNPQEDTVHYPDIDLQLPTNGTVDPQFTNKQGKPYSA